MKKKVLFICCDGALTVASSAMRAGDDPERFRLLPGVIRNLYFIRRHLDFELVVITCRKDGEEQIDRRALQKTVQLFEDEGIVFDDVLTGLPSEEYPYDPASSFLVGDRPEDMQAAEQTGCRFILIASQDNPFPTCQPSFAATGWEQIAEYLFAGERTAEVRRTTKETDIRISLNLDGTGHTEIATGIGFFDHMLEQMGKHSGMDLLIQVKGDLHIDEHHTIEDTAIALGEALAKALGDKRGIERYGFCLPMDDCLCSVTMDFGGRPWLVYDVTFRREKIGEMPTEMFRHFFKSLSDAARMNLHIRAAGENEHHKAEGIFKALAKAIKMAIRRDIYHFDLPSTKGLL